VKHLLAAMIAMLATPVLADPGTVIAVGGALQDDNAEVYRAMIDAMPQGAPAIVVIPAASGFAGGSAQRFADTLARYGVDPSRVVLAKVATVDDPETPQIDEASWKGGGSDPAEIANLRDAGLIWFSGGDQARIIATMVQADGSDTPMLAAIRQRLAQGAVVGGTSAGAAVLGEHMIACGSPDIALTAPVSYSLSDCAAAGEDADKTPLVLGKGLGFVERVVFDQHFTQRGRLVRLVRAVACIEGMPIGVGVDEDTAMVFDLSDPVGRTVGRGTVTTLHAAADGRRCEGAVLGPTLLTRRSAQSRP
jgi:cyanophycinase